MILYFPDIDTLRFSITSGVVPTGVSLAPAVAGRDDEGHIWIQPSVALSRTAQGGLKKLGVHFDKDSAPLTEEVTCWPQLLPVRREGLPPLAAQAPVLFELSDSTQLPRLVAEMLRLGNDRQGFRHIEDGAHTRVLLRVVGPPYYTLLHALERDGPAAPRAFIERAPRVWVELGHGHPLIEQVQPPPGTLLLVRPPREWTIVEDRPFHDIYEILDLTLPEAAVQWLEAALSQRLKVPIRLTVASSNERAELWVVRDRAVEQLDSLVGSTNDQLLSRLSFAVIPAKDAELGPTVVLRARPSKLAAPIIELDGVSFRPFQKLPNLFVPCGSRLKPPLRRDAVRKLLADDPARITWLFPHAEGRFVPESLPDQAFQPLERWIDYILDRDHEAMEAWIGAARFDFEPFICKDDQSAEPRPPKEKEPRKGVGKRDRDRLDTSDSPDDTTEIEVPSRKKPRPEVEDLALSRAKPSELQVKLRGLEKAFLDLKAPLDAPQRQETWHAMAQVNSALGNALEAFVCWANAFWEVEAAPKSSAWGWFLTEAKDGDPSSGVMLDRLLEVPDPLPADVRALAAGLVWAAACEPAPRSFVDRLDRLQRYLEKHDRLLSVRGCWLAWIGLTRLSHGDVLALARARDRLLERLYRSGLSADLDLPGFLRFSGQRAGERFQAVRERVVHLRDLARQWASNDPGQPQARTATYVDLFFAFGMARLGEVTECRRLLDAAKPELDVDEIHSFLLEAYTHRIEQVLEGRGHEGPLAHRLLEYLEERFKGSQGKTDEKSKELRLHRYKIDKLREHSRILEPQDRVESYRHWHGRHPDGLTAELSMLPDILDRNQLLTKLNALLGSHTMKSGAMPVALARHALEAGPRLGEDFSRDLIDRVKPTFAQLPALLKRTTDPAERAFLLEQSGRLFERALFLSAHYGRGEELQAFVERFAEFLEAQRIEDLVKHADTTISQCFRGLRKFGLSDPINRLLKQMTDMLLQGEELSALSTRVLLAAKEGRAVGHEPTVLRTLLYVAGGWLYFGRDAEAMPVLDAVRKVLFEGRLPSMEQTHLACAYVSTLGQAPVAEALRRVEEVFRDLENVRDSFTVSTHYSLSQLRVVEAVVLAVVNDEFAAGTEVRRWLDDDEYLVRRRIHRDMNAALGRE